MVDPFRAPAKGRGYPPLPKPDGESTMTSQRPRRRLAVAAAALLMAAAGSSPAAAAQDRAADDSCPLLTMDEVTAAIGNRKLTLLPDADASYCYFDGEPYLQVQVTRERLADMAAFVPDGEPMTVAGHDAWWSSELSPTLWVAADDWVGGVPRVLQIGTSERRGEDPLPGLLQLAEAAMSRLPAPPAESAVQRLRSFIPDDLGGSAPTFLMDTGDSLLWALQFQPADAEALAAAFDEAGRRPHEAFFVSASLGSSGEQAIVAIELPGMDAASVMLPVVRAFYPPADDLGATRIGDKEVTLLAQEPNRYAYATGDLLFYVNDLGQPLDELFAALP
jgi:hypothetical protein